jgi:hypothetical protein
MEVVFGAGGEGIEAGFAAAGLGVALALRVFSAASKAAVKTSSGMSPK